MTLSTVALLLVLAAFVLTIVAAGWRPGLLWVAVLLLCIVGLLGLR